MAATPSSHRATQAHELLRLSYRDALALFAELPAPTMAEMSGEYRAELLDQGPAVFTWIAMWAVHLKGRWLAKAFNPESSDAGRGYNVFVIGERVVRGTRMRTQVGPSQHDGRPAYQLDYSADNRGWMATMRDEVRRVAPGLYLGLGVVGYGRLMRRPAPFLMEGPVAPFVD